MPTVASSGCSSESGNGSRRSVVIHTALPVSAVSSSGRAGRREGSDGRLQRPMLSGVHSSGRARRTPKASATVSAWTGIGTSGVA